MHEDGIKVYCLNFRACGQSAVVIFYRFQCVYRNPFWAILQEPYSNLNKFHLPLNTANRNDLEIHKMGAIEYLHKKQSAIKKGSLVDSASKTYAKNGSDKICKSF